jgi:hypothetical protein
MSHFIALIENALKSGNVSDPAFREGVYKGALRAFDKMSDQRPDKTEFRKLHGPQLAEAITRIEQKYVTFEDDETLNHEPMDKNFDAAVSMRADPDFTSNPTSSEIGNLVEPDVASIDEDVFLAEERPVGAKPIRQKSIMTLLILGAILVILILGVLIWLVL